MAEPQTTTEAAARDRLSEIQERYKDKALYPREVYEVRANDLAWLIQEVQLSRSRVSPPSVAPEVDENTAAHSCERYAEMIESQNDLSGQTENWQDFHRGQHYAAKQLADAFRSAPASTVAPQERLFEAKLMGFEDNWRVRLCEPCVRRATEDDLVIFACALPLDIPVATVAPQEQSEPDKATPLCEVHQRLEDADALECEIGNDCVACSLNERRALLELIAPLAAEGNTEDSVTVLRRIAEFYETHVGEGRAVVSYPAASPAAPPESPILAFEAWLMRWVADNGRKLNQDEYGIAYAAFIAAHPGEGPQAHVMAPASPAALRDEAELPPSVKTSIDSLARHIARPIRGCATDDQYCDVLQRATDALIAAAETLTTKNTASSTRARKAAEAIQEWLRTGDGEVDANAINEVASIIERHLSLR